MEKYIEQETNYAYAVRYSDALSFQLVRKFARHFIELLPEGLRCKLHNQLQHGVRQLQSEPEMNMYVCAFGAMHEAKLHHAFKRLPNEFLNYPSIDIIDYGCGQAFGAICYADYLRGNKLSQVVRRVVLIDPSEIVLKRAALHASSMFPSAKVVTILKGFDDLNAVDLGVDAKTPTLHIFSNVIDLADDYFDLGKFAQLIKGCAQDNNQFVCVGPYFDYFEKDGRIERFAKLLNIKIYYSNHFPKGTFRKGHDWSCNVVMGEKKQKTTSVVTNRMSARALKEKYGEIKFIKVTNTNKVFFACGNIKGYVSKLVRESLNEITIDDIQYAEISINGEKAVPCLFMIQKHHQNQSKENHTNASYDDLPF